MMSYKIDKVNNIQILDKNTLEPIADWSGIGNTTIETEIEPNSLSKEVLEFNHSASFKGELIDFSLSNFNTTNFNTTNFNGKPFYIEYYIPIMIQARWHKKKRINKKWLKRYGMKKDKVSVKCDIDSISPDNSYDPYDLIESKGFNLEISNMQYKFRPDQLRRNLKIEACYG